MGKISQSEKQRVWALLSEAGLVDIPADKFSERVKDAKKAIIEQLGELLASATDVEERNSAAYSLATVKKLETALQRIGSPPRADYRLDDPKS